MKSDNRRVLLDWDKQSAVERQFMIVGEALIRIKKFEPDVLDRIPESRAIIGFRNVLVHGYDVADPEAVFRLAGESVTDLIALVNSTLEV